MIPNQKERGNIDKLGINFKDFSLSKNTIKRETIEWGKVFATDKTGKASISMY